MESTPVVEEWHERLYQQQQRLWPMVVKVDQLAETKFLGVVR